MSARGKGGKGLGKGKGRGGKSKPSSDDMDEEGLETGPTPMETETTSTTTTTTPSTTTPSSTTTPARTSSKTASASASATTPSGKKEELINSLKSVTMGTGIDLVFSFDTTGSMYSYLKKVRDDIRETATRLLKEVPALRIAIIAHGDYCDSSVYVTKHIDFSTNATEIENFVESVPSTGGGDTPEAYELAMKVAGDLSWNKDSSKAFVMIGDAPPHAPSYTDQNIYWRDEVNKLRLKGIKMYGVYCGKAAPTNSTSAFFEEIADLTGGVFLELGDIKFISDMFRAVCFREADPSLLSAYEAEVDKREGGMEKGLKSMFRTLSGANRSLAAKTTGRTFSDDWWTRENDHGTGPTYKFDAESGKWSGATYGLGASRGGGGFGASSRPPVPPKVTKVKKVKKDRPSVKAASKAGTRATKKTSTSTTGGGRASRSTSKSPARSVPKRSKSPATKKTRTAAKKSAPKKKKTVVRKRKPMASIWTLGPLSEPEKPRWAATYVAPSGARHSTRIKDARRKEQRKARSKS